MRYFYLLLFLWTFKAFGQTEQRCIHKSKPFSLRQQELINKQLQKNNLRLEQDILVIPVVFHIVYNTQKQYFTYDQVIKQLEVMNKDFRRLNDDASVTPAPFQAVAGDAGIQFVLAKQDPEGNPTTGVTYTNTAVTSFSGYNDNVRYTTLGGIDAWDTQNYLNIWVAFMPDVIGTTNPIDPGAETDGLAITSKAFSTYGDMISDKYDRGRTATHEIGHWLGLTHIWGDANCGDDHIADTPKQATSTSESLNCPPFPYKPNFDLNCNTSENGRMFCNYLDYTRDACMNMFTKDQATFMRGVLTGVRSKILTSPGLRAPFKNDVAVLGIHIDTASFCSRASMPSIYIRIANLGSDTIKNFELIVNQNGAEERLDWEGELLQGKDSIFEISAKNLNIDQKNTISCTVKNLQYPTEEYMLNNFKTIEFTCTTPLSVCPNPSFDTFFIIGNSPVAKEATIYNAQGQQIGKYSNPKTIDVSNFTQGYYLLFLETGDGIKRYNLIVLH